LNTAARQNRLRFRLSSSISFHERRVQFIKLRASLLDADYPQVKLN
jgi:hypothetical protein